jgi:hypothetical protein
MTKIVTDDQLGPAVKQHGVSFLVETGNNNNSEIGNFFHKMTKQPAFEGSLRSISFVTKDSCRAIQLADFFAFYSRRHMRNHHRFPGGMLLPACPYLQIMQNHGRIWLQAGFTGLRITDARIDELANLSALAAVAKSEHP